MTYAEMNDFRQRHNKLVRRRYIGMWCVLALSLGLWATIWGLIMLNNRFAGDVIGAASVWIGL